MDMKNLTGREILEQGTDAITIVRAEIPAGVTFTYTSAKAELRDALQSWAVAQQR